MAREVLRVAVDFEVSGKRKRGRPNKICKKQVERRQRISV